jgi:hypothetical protein
MVNIPNTNVKAQVIISSLAHKQTVSFFPYDFDIDDSYKPDWGTYDAFGRMDPIMTYKRTTRDVNLSFNVVAEDETTARSNFNNLQTLIKCLYPTYQDADILSTSANILQAKRDELLAQQQELIRRQEAADLHSSAGLIEAGDVDGDGTTLNVTTGQQLESEIITNEQEVQKNEAQITQQFQIARDFGVKVINKSPLFQISFMNLLTQQQFVAAITSFKHKMKFDAADTSFSADGKVIPGEFSINISFKVLHKDIPGNILNYGS